MKSLLKICLFLTEVSSIVLLILTMVFIISGYGLVRTGIVRRLTFGLITRREAELLHTSVQLRVLFNIFLIIHCLSGLTLMLHRRVRNRLLRTILLIIVAISILYFIVPLLLIDIFF